MAQTPTDDPSESDESRAPASLTLSLDELVPDRAGEVVIIDSAGDGVRLIAESQVIGEGVASDHVTQGGIDVTGLRFVSFQSGITVYYSGSDAMALSSGLESG